MICSNLDEGGHAVGGARGVGDDGVLVLVIISIDTDDEGGDLLILGGGSDQDLLGASLGRQGEGEGIVRRK